MEAVNGNIGVSPFPEQKAIKRIGPALAVGGHMTLVRLRVILGNERFPVGSTVLVRANHASAPWSREVFEFEGIVEPFVFIPESVVSVVEKATATSVLMATTGVDVSSKPAPNVVFVAG
jgi:hypothetical protein